MMTSTADQRLRPRVTVDLSPGYQFWLDNEFTDDRAFDVAGDLSLPPEYVHHAAVYWAASSHRRVPIVAVELQKQDPTPLWIGLPVVTFTVIGAAWLAVSLVNLAIGVLS